MGAILVIIIAFVFAEICTMIPITGSSARIPCLTHGVFLSFIFAFVIWLGYMFYVPAEIQAIIQYLAVFFPSLVSSDTHALTGIGYFWAVLCIFIFTVISVYSIRWLIKANSYITVFKIILPVTLSLIIIFYLIFCHMGTEKINVILSKGSFGVLTAISTGGIFFAFNGFKLAAELAGDAKNPRVALPVAIIGSVTICLAIYLLLQYAFMLYMSHDTLDKSVQDVINSSRMGPFAYIGLHTEGLKYLLPFIYAGAIVAPFAAGIVYFVSSVKAFQGLAKNNYFPPWLAYVNKRKSPVFAILINFVCASSAFLFFHGWDRMAEIITILFCISYTIGPINLYTLRLAMPKFDRPFKLPLAWLWCLLALYGCTVAVYWCGFNTIMDLTLIIAIGLIIYISHLLIGKKSLRALNISCSIWFFIYIAGVILVSFLGDQAGGMNVIKGFTPLIVLFVFCIFILIIAVKTAMPRDKIKQAVEEALHAERPKPSLHGT